MSPLRIGNPAVTLVVAPHADDETIGAYGLIRLLRLRGREVRVVVVTDGAASHPSSPGWPRARLVAERRRETRRAMRGLGVSAGKIRFLGLPDGGLGEVSAHFRAIARAARRIAGLRLVVAPTPADAHPDHRATAVGLALALLPGVRRLSYLVWGDKMQGRSLFLREARTMKRAAIRRYRTQMGWIADDPAGFQIAPNELRAFSRPAELFREERPCGRSR